MNCPKCGAALKAGKPEAKTPTDWRRERWERRRDEKAEKNEKAEKGEKHEKREYPFIGPLIGGLILGGLVVAYFTKYGIYIGDYGMTGILMGDTIYAYLTVQDTISLAIAAYVITLVASLYPATLAARMEPVEALHGQ